VNVALRELRVVLVVVVVLLLLLLVKTKPLGRVFSIQDPDLLKY